MSFLRDSTLVFLYRLILVAVVFVTDVAIARWFGPTGKGALAILTVTPAILAVLGLVGQDYALNHARTRGQAGLLAVFTQALGLSCLMTAVIVGVLLFDVAGIRSTLFRGVPSSLQVAEYMSLGIIPAEAAFTLAGMLAVSVGLPVLYAQLRVLRRMGVLVGCTLAVVLLGAGTERAMTAIVLVQIVTIGGGAVVGVMLAGWRLHAPCGSWKQLATQGFAAWPGRLAERLQGRVDYVLLGILGSGSAVGVYSVATALAEMLYFVTGSVSTALFSRRVGGDGDLHRRVVRLMVPFAGMCAVGAGLLGTILVPGLYGVRFAGGVTLLWILLPGVVGMSLVQILSPYLVQTGRAHAVSVGQVIGVVANVLINMLLIPRFAAVGAAVASSVSYSLTFLVIAIWTARTDQRPLHHVLIARSTDWQAAAGRAKAFLGRVGA